VITWNLKTNAAYVAKNPVWKEKRQVINTVQSVYLTAYKMEKDCLTKPPSKGRIKNET
jgi:hypothetical protein